MIADEVYVSLPNLYTLRGTKFRDAMRWAAASERVLAWDVDLPANNELGIRRVSRTIEHRVEVNTVLGERPGGYRGSGLGNDTGVMSRCETCVG
ncbi:MAG TPA: hypothetical protein VK866_01535 [Acidimicrobiales bacterium]|nr:hypothetical protein [Acidimicrobiales bacterium]